MWEKPFEPSMLNDDVIIFCPEEELAPALMELLAAYGVKWDLKGRLVNHGSNFWGHRREKTCYRISNKRMRYSSRAYYEVAEQFQHYIKCTFYGETEDFEPASNSELMAFLGL